MDTAAQISMISQSFLDSLKPTVKVSRASGNPYDVVGHAANVAKHLNLPTWIVLRIAALNAKAFYGVYVQTLHDHEWYDYIKVGNDHTHERYYYTYVEYNHTHKLRTV